MNVTDTSKLTESPGVMKKHPHSGANYHDGEQIISHLNYALGPDGWDWEEMDHGFDEQADQVWVRGKLTARFLSHADEDEGYKTTSCSKIERGWNDVKRKRDDRTKLVDLGSDYKGADTDALKRAARLLGVGLDAWEKDAPQQRQQQAPNRPAPPRPAPAPVTDIPLAERPALLARYRELLEHAQGVGFRASWVGTDPETWNDIQLTKYSGLLENHIARNTEAAS